MHIDVVNLQKHYRVHHKAEGLSGSLRAFFRRRYETVRAVDGLTFQVAPGEVVGFLGPNGAGKTTTLKMLSGLLHPSGGRLRVLGYAPFERNNAFLKQITLVMGQKQQLLWDLPAIETLAINKAIYEIGERDYRRTLDELTELLELAPLLTKQVRKLSLGERMKCELAAALLHKPQILFLDEPTIGLDVGTQGRVRQFIADYNARHGATVLLTSHYMADVTALCRRILVINHGKLLYDGDLRSLIEQVAPHKVMRLTLERPVQGADLARYGQVQHQKGLEVELLVERGETTRLGARLLSELPVVDITIEEPAIEDIIQEVFAGTVDSAVRLDA
jgi:ABC-2 type transport system ATP-binding protein